MINKSKSSLFEKTDKMDKPLDKINPGKKDGIK